MRSLFLLLALSLPNLAHAERTTQLVHTYAVRPSKNISTQELFKLFGYMQNAVGNGICSAFSKMTDIDSVDGYITVAVYTVRDDDSAETLRECDSDTFALVDDWTSQVQGVKVTIMKP